MLIRESVVDSEIPGHCPLQDGIGKGIAISKIGIQSP